MTLTDLLKGVRSAALGVAVVAGGGSGCGGEEKDCERFQYLCSLGGDCGNDNCWDYGNPGEPLCRKEIEDLLGLTRTFTYEDVAKEDCQKWKGVDFDDYQCAFSMEPNLYLMRNPVDGSVCPRDGLLILTNGPYSCNEADNSTWGMVCIGDNEF